MGNGVNKAEHPRVYGKNKFNVNHSRVYGEYKPQYKLRPHRVSTRQIDHNGIQATCYSEDIGQMWNHDEYNHAERSKEFVLQFLLVWLYGTSPCVRGALGLTVSIDPSPCVRGNTKLSRAIPVDTGSIALVSIEPCVKPTTHIKERKNKLPNHVSC